MLVGHRTVHDLATAEDAEDAEAIQRVMQGIVADWQSNAFDLTMVLDDDQESNSLTGGADADLFLWLAMDRVRDNRSGEGDRS